MRLQLWHLVVLAVPMAVAVLMLLYFVVRGGVRHGMRDASRTREERLSG